ncbi:MAG: hypothetical protein EOL87_07430 [Spartobacteria bacterium]|nr:hypothetical protein [Spartobacteria bacterium]
MRIVIFHYHLRTGGVTRVIADAVQALHASGVQTLVVAGEEPCDAWAEELGPVLVDPVLRYDGNDAQFIQPLRKKICDQLGGDPDVWHIHNHSLGKNTTLPQLVDHLSGCGAAMVLQLHDVAEDGRPANYRYLRQSLERLWGGLNRLYPVSPRILYAFLNGRDAALFGHVGLKKSIILSNAVKSDQILNDTSRHEGRDEPQMIIYPTRAIRRKNIGELVLWAAVFGDEKQFCVTRAPKNPKERPFYDAWVAFCSQNNIPVRWEYGKDFASMGDVMRLAHAAITTSIAEGFGLAYIEPWLYGCPLVGRDLPAVTRRIKEEGVCLDGLYATLPVPLDWVGAEAVEQAAGNVLREMADAYGLTTDAGFIDHTMKYLTDGGVIDFGRLNESLQRHVIRDVVVSDEKKAYIRGFWQENSSMKIIDGNRQCIEDRFNLSHYGKRLMTLYDDVASGCHEPAEHLDAAEILKGYLMPDNIYLSRGTT